MKEKLKKLNALLGAALMGSSQTVTSGAETNAEEWTDPVSPQGLASAFTPTATAGASGGICWNLLVDGDRVCFQTLQMGGNAIMLVGNQWNPSEASATPVDGSASYDPSTNRILLRWDFHNATNGEIKEFAGSISLQTLSGYWKDDQGGEGDLMLTIAPGSADK